MKRIPVLVLLLTLPALAKWPTYNFVIQDELKLMAPADIANTRAFYARVAQDLDRLGFPAPVLALTKQTDGSPAYRVVLKNQKPSYYADTKGAEHLIIGCKDPDGFTGGRLNYFGWMVLAHELFHAVQASMNYQQGRRVGGWITEGTADAIGFHYADKFKGNLKTNAFNTNERTLGARSYSYPLATPVRDASDPGSAENNYGYKSSSFWRYLAWRNGPRTGPYGTNENIKYLKDFLDRPILEGDRFEQELRWLDDNLREFPKFKTGLYQLYPEFVATYTDPDYHKVMNNPSAFQAYVLGNPTEMEAKVGEVTSARIELEPVAAGWVRVSMPIKANLWVTGWAGTSDDRRIVAGTRLHLGILDKTASQNVSPVAESRDISRQGVVTWVLPLEQGTHYLQLSHLAPKPQDTPKTTFNLNLSIPKNKVVQSKATETTGSADVGYGNRKTSISFPSPKEAELQTRLQMMRHDSEANLAAPNREMGGGLEAYAALQAEIAANPDQFEDREFPVIRIPGLKPGETGTFNNAEIERTHPDFGRLKAVREENGVRRPSGKVTVTEHSPAMLKGTYEGELLDSRLRSRETISGTFAIPSPIRFEELDYYVDHAGDLNVDRLRSRMTPDEAPQGGGPDGGENGDGSNSGDSPGVGGSAGAAGGAATSGAAQSVDDERTRLVRRYKAILQKAGASGESLEAQLKMTDDMSLEDLRDFVNFLEANSPK